jgi:hypothetical protein
MRERRVLIDERARAGEQVDHRTGGRLSARAGGRLSARAVQDLVTAVGQDVGMPLHPTSYTTPTDADGSKQAATSSPSNTTSDTHA